MQSCTLRFETLCSAILSTSLHKKTMNLNGNLQTITSFSLQHSIRVDLNEKDLLDDLILQNIWNVNHWC